MFSCSEERRGERSQEISQRMQQRKEESFAEEIIWHVLLACRLLLALWKNIQF